MDEYSGLQYFFINCLSLVVCCSLLSDKTTTLASIARAATETTTTIKKNPENVNPMQESMAGNISNITSNYHNGNASDAAQGISFADHELIHLAGSAELNSEHTLAKAICDYAKDYLQLFSVELIQPESFKPLAGKGIPALVTLNGRLHQVKIGSCKQMFGDDKHDQKHQENEEKRHEQDKQDDNNNHDMNMNQTELPKGLAKYQVQEILSQHASRGNITFLMSVDTVLNFYIILSDPCKPESNSLIKYLGIKTYITPKMLTDGSRLTANAVARELEINKENVISQILPQDMHQVSKQLQCGIDFDETETNSAGFELIELDMKLQNTKVSTIESGDTNASMLTIKNETKNCMYANTVAMVSDGTNDAEALTQANLAISVGNGIEITIETADVILLNDNFINVLTLLQISNCIIRGIYLNFVWTLGFNCLGIPIPVGILYSIWKKKLVAEFAAITMACSSILVVTSSLQLRWYKSPFDEKEKKEENSQIYQAMVDDSNNNNNTDGLKMMSMF